MVYEHIYEVKKIAIGVAKGLQVEKAYPYSIRADGDAFFNSHAAAGQQLLTPQPAPALS